MNPFIPTDFLILLKVFLLVLVIVVGGYGVCQIRNYRSSVILAWLFVIGSISFVQIISYSEPPGIRMVALIISTLFTMKIVVGVEWYKGSNFKLSFFQWTCFVVGWFGMKPKLFESLGSKSLEGGKSLVVFGISRVIIGITLLILGKVILINQPIFLLKLIAVGLLLGGLSLILHFGVLNISAGMWRFSGADTRTLFKKPLLATSLTEFWGKRWNLAFSEMTSIALYRPLRSLIGPTKAMIIAFLFSGLLHELAVSVPVKAGYGLPLLYFLIHGLVMYVEKVVEKKGFKFSDHKVFSRIWVIFWLVAPMSLLFHKAFLNGIVLPLFN
jgi:alginate O-acetyltransferase complex protein AlgI